jgi:hypothetical protein
VKHEDTNELVKKIKDLMSDKNKMKKVSKKAFEDVSRITYKKVIA